VLPADPFSQTNPALLTAETLSRNIEGRTLLDAVSLRLNPGDRIGLVGPTGSGKSLLLRSLGMLEPIDSGSLLWQRSPVTSHQATHYRSQVIYLHQRAARFEGTVESVLRIPYQLAIHRGQRFDRVWMLKQLAAIGRDERFLSQPHEQLSGGETQIVALLRAVQLAPKVLLLDEPTSALDAASTQHVESIVSSWYESAPESRAMIWVSHDHGQAERVSDSIMHMLDGKISTDREDP
jgi:putative ABC transport system ATP-binding protein